MQRGGVNRESKLVGSLSCLVVMEHDGDICLRKDRIAATHIECKVIKRRCRGNLTAAVFLDSALCAVCICAQITCDLRGQNRTNACDFFALCCAKVAHFNLRIDARYKAQTQARIAQLIHKDLIVQKEDFKLGRVIPANRNLAARAAKKLAAFKGFCA